MLTSRIETPPPPLGILTTGISVCSRRHFGWRRHGTDDWLLIYTISGQGRFGTTKRNLIAESGDIVLIRPHTPHDYGATAPKCQWTMIWAHFVPDGAWLPWLHWPTFAPGVFLLRLENKAIRVKVVERLKTMNRFAKSPLRHGMHLAKTALQEAILRCDCCIPRAGEVYVDERILKAINQMSENLGNRIELGKLAELSGLSVSRFSHLFRARTGKSPQRYFEELRMQQAKQMLGRTGLAISEIAYELGYDDPLYFSSRFKRCTGFSPSAFRKELGKR